MGLKDCFGAIELESPKVCDPSSTDMPSLPCRDNDGVKLGSKAGAGIAFESAGELAKKLGMASFSASFGLLSVIELGKTFGASGVAMGFDNAAELAKKLGILDSAITGGVDAGVKDCVGNGIDAVEAGFDVSVEG